MEGFVSIGFVQSVYRDSPVLRVQVLTNYPERFAAGNFVYFEFSGGKPSKQEIEESYPEKQSFLVKFKNFDTPDSCEVFIDKHILIPETDLKVLPDDEFYIHDLIGSEVVIENQVAGKITDVMLLPANDVYTVETPSGIEFFVPAVKDVIDRFDRQNKCLFLKVNKSFFDYED